MNKKLIESLLMMLVADEPTTDETPLEPALCGLEGEYVIVRCRDAGVHAGTLVSLDGRTAVLKDSRRLWYWEVAENQHSLSGVASVGIASESKIPAVIETAILPEACEVLSVSDKAMKTIVGANVYET